jgi:josephin
LNNLFQVPKLFTHEYLDGIAHEFDKRSINNDYATLWIGDYDLRILIEAITRRGHPVRQINYFTGEPLQNLPWDTYFGLLLNLNGAHWFTIKNINGLYYNLDSTFPKPSQIGLKDALVSYLIHLIQQFKNVYIFTVLQETNRPFHS